MADRSGGRTVGFILCLILSAFFLLFALGTSLIAGNAAEKVYDEKGPDTSPPSCAHPPKNSSQDYWDCIFDYEESNGGDVAEYNAQVAARQSSAETAGNRAVAFAVVGLTLGVLALAFNVTRSAERGAENVRRRPAHAPAAASAGPVPGTQPAPQQGRWQAAPPGQPPQGQPPLGQPPLGQPPHGQPPQL